MAHPTFSTPYNWEKRRINELIELAQKEDGTSLPVHYQNMDLSLIPEDSLKDALGKTVSPKQLLGKSVALYFASSKSRKCNNFFPFLLQFYRTINEGGKHQVIEVIFVSLDSDRESFLKYRERMPWLNIDIDDPVTKTLKRHFRIYNPGDGLSFGTAQRSIVPALVICGSQGEETQLLPISNGREEGARGLLRWDWRNTVYR